MQALATILWLGLKELRSLSRDVDRWEQLEIHDLPRTLAKQLPALRLEHGSDITLANAVATHLVLDLYTGPGRYDVTIDDLLVSGVVSPVAPRHRAIRDPLVQAAAATQPVPAANAGTRMAVRISSSASAVAYRPR